MSNKTDISDIPDLEYLPDITSSRSGLASALTCILERSGFSYSKSESEKEEVWIRQLDSDPNIRIKVYTSITSSNEKINGKMYWFRATRKCGKDAIRICATKIINGKEIGFVKSNRINRTGSLKNISKRTLFKMREVYKIANNRRGWNPLDKN